MANVIMGQSVITVRSLLRRRVIDGVLAVPRPVLERAVVEHHRVSEQARRKEHRRRLLSDVAVTDDRVAWLDAGLGEERQQLVSRLGDQLIVNPGAAGARRFKLEPSVGILTVAGGSADAELVPLAG